MIKKREDIFLDLKKIISKEGKIINEMSSFFHTFGSNKMGVDLSVMSQINYLKFHLMQENDKIPEVLEKINLKKALNVSGNEEMINGIIKSDKKKKRRRENIFDIIEKNRKLKQFRITELEKRVIKRINKSKKEEVRKKERKPNIYAGIASRIFSNVSGVLIKDKNFNTVVRDLLKTNLKFIPTIYISMMLLSTLISLGVALIIFLFLLFFKITATPPFISFAGDLMIRFLSLFWILFVIPIITFISLYFYPSMERKSLEMNIDQELPFATINMSAIAASRIEPTNIFGIIVSTGEYPNLKKQFVKVINEINIYGHDLVYALRSSISSCPSKKLAELYSGLATNITSGGDLAAFFEKRSQTLLLDYRLQREKSTKSAETFIDIYISIVIAAPMILMLLLTMIQVSGLGVSLSPSLISLIMVLGVTLINVGFLIFLRLRQPTQ